MCNVKRCTMYQSRRLTENESKRNFKEENKLKNPMNTKQITKYNLCNNNTNTNTVYLWCGKVYVYTLYTHKERKKTNRTNTISKQYELNERKNEKIRINTYNVYDRHKHTYMRQTHTNENLFGSHTVYRAHAGGSNTCPCRDNNQKHWDA